MVGDIITGNVKSPTFNSYEILKNFEALEAYVDNIDVDFHADESIFNSIVCKLNTPVFNKINRSKYGKRTDYKKDFVEVIGSNC